MSELRVRKVEVINGCPKCGNKTFYEITKRLGELKIVHMICTQCGLDIGVKESFESKFRSGVYFKRLNRNE